MGIDVEFPQGRVPEDAAGWARTFRKVPVTPSAGSVTPNELASSTTDLIDDTASTVAAQAVADHVAQSDPHPQYTVQADIDSAAGSAQAGAIAASSASLAAHASDSADPHSAAGYLKQSETDALYVPLANVLNGSATYDPPSLADGAATSTTVTVPGAALSDFALASFSLSTQGIAVSAMVTASDTVTVVLFNKTGGTIDLASGTLRVRVWK